jgi:uncharacterized damage-inducible protein DinB
MAGNVRPVTDERDGLLAFLAQQRDALRFALQDLSEEQASSRPTASSLSLAGLIKHAAFCERGWITGIMAQRDPGPRDWNTEFQLQDGETLAGMLALYDEVAQETESIVAETDLDKPVPVPKGVPWFPQDVDAWSVRWVLLHLIEETARHAGHADMLREAIDGKSAYLIQAGFQS